LRLRENKNVKLEARLKGRVRVSNSGAAVEVVAVVMLNYPEDTHGSGGIAPQFLTSVLDGVEWSPSSPSSFTPRKRALCMHWIGGRVDVRCGLDAV
jgi:hypothetical protein